MSEQSHLDEMNAAIRAQRERHAVPRSIVAEAEPEPLAEAAAPEREPEPRRGWLARLLGR